MLKWFRKYNKFILAVGCVVLMVAFLIPQAVSMFSPRPQDRVLGTMAGDEITGGDLDRAAMELDLLRGMGLPELLVPYDRERWLMIQKDAGRLGLDASAGEVNAVLDIVGLGPEALAQRARESKVPAAFFRQVVRHWLVSERYRMLMMGRRYDGSIALAESPGLTTLNLWTREFLPAMEQIQQMDQGTADAVMNQLVGSFSIVRAGHGRISPPAVEFFARNQLELVGGRVAVLTPQLDENAAVDDTQLQRLFEEYKQYFPGQGAPYPLGYRKAERVDVEFLRFPSQAALDAVTVEPLDVLEFYRENKDNFAADGEEAPAMPTDEVRGLIEEQLRMQKAGQLLQRAIAEARAALDEDVRALETEGGYKVLPEGFRPIPLEEVADRVAERTGLEPLVGTTGGWVTLSELSTEPEGFGTSRLPGSGIPVANYLSFARGLHDGSQTLSVRLQAGVAGEVTVGPDQSVYLPRLIGAQPSEIPASLDEVREQVTADARTVRAYEDLAAQVEALQQRAADEGLSALAAEFDATVETVESLPRRDPGAQSRDGRPQPPSVPGVGRSDALLEQIFGIVADVPPGASLLDVKTAEERVVAVPVDRTMAVAVFEVTSYDTPTRSAYESIRQQNAVVADDLPLLGDARLLMRPLTTEALAERVGYELPRDGEDENDEAASGADAPEAQG